MPPSLPVDNYVNGYKSLANYSTASVVFADAVNSAAANTTAQNVAATLAFAEMLAASAVKVLPGISNSVAVGLILTNADVARVQFAETGKIQVGTLTNIASGVTAILSTVGTGALAAASLPTAPVIAAAAVVVVGLSAVAIAYGDVPVGSQELQVLVTELGETVQETIDGVQGLGEHFLELGIEPILNLLEVGAEIPDLVKSAGENLTDLVVKGFNQAGVILEDLATKGWNTVSDILGKWVDSGRPLGEGLGPLLDQLAKASDPFSGMPSEAGSPFPGLANYPQRADPFVLDLGGNGFDLRGTSSNPVYFDSNGDGIKTATGWVLPGDGFLVFDLNANGLIDNGKELFGDSTPLIGGGTAIDGFHALEQQDTNFDGIVNSLDTNWSGLKVWRDLNQDGISQSDELSSLTSLSIIGINVAKQSHRVQLINGNVIADKGTFVWADGGIGSGGSVGGLADIDLIQSSFYRTFATNIPLTEGAKNVPNIGGSGGVRDLREAASLSAELLSLLEQFEGASPEDRLTIMDPILKAWADTSTLATTFTGAYASQILTVDMQAWYQGPEYVEGGEGYIATAEKLTVVERFNGTTYQPVPTHTGNVNLTLFHIAMGLLDESYNALKTSVYENLLKSYQFESTIKPLLSKIGIVETSGVLNFDFTNVVSELDIKFQNNSKEGIAQLIEFSKYFLDLDSKFAMIAEAKLAEYLANQALTQQMVTELTDEHIFIKGLVNYKPNGSDLSDAIIGGSGNDSISGGNGNDILFGFSGNDKLDGGNGKDYLFGGAGNDRLVGGADSDTYVINIGDGFDTIEENDATSTNVDTILLVDRDQNIAQLSRSFDTSGNLGNNLIVSFLDSTDRITVLDYFLDERYRVEKIVFSDNTEWAELELSQAPLAPEVPTAFGTSGDETFDLRKSVSTLVYGYTSAAINSGNDTYIFGVGAGQDSILDYGESTNLDTVRIKELLSDRVVLEREADTSGSLNLVVKLLGSTDTLTILNQFGGIGNYAIEQIEFDDGTIWNSEIIATAAITPASTGNYEGTSGVDYFDLRHSTNATVYGYTGASIDSGNDTYIFGAGAGQDSVLDYGVAQNTDTVRIKGLTTDQISLQRLASGNGSSDLLIKVIGSTDTLAILNQFGGIGNYAIEQIEFDDGTIWNSEIIATAAITPASTGNYEGTSGVDYFDLRHSTNATVYGYTGASIDSGNDTYIFGEGAGKDSILDYGSSSNNLDSIRVKGLLVSEVDIYRKATTSGSLDLVISVNNSTTQLTVLNQFSAGGNYSVEQIEFDDGTIWNLNKILKAPIKPVNTTAAWGTAASDYFDLRSSTNNTVYGYTGSSTESGDDTYIFGIGSGIDNIQDYGSTLNNLDTIRVVGLMPSEVKVYRKASVSGSLDLVVGIENSNDQLIVLNQFSSGGNYAIEQIEFDDGTIWNFSFINQAPITPTNSTAALGTSGDDFFDLRSIANSTVYGYSSSSSESGNDTYIFGVGSGKDKIQDYGNATQSLDTIRVIGLLPSQVEIYRKATTSGSTDLIVGTDNPSDYVTVLNQFVTGGSYAIERIEFDDGTIWDSTIISRAAITPTSTAAAQGTSADDYFDLRNSVSTTVYGYSPSSSESGNDTYIFGAGSGKDKINDYGIAAQNLDTVRIVGLLPSEVEIYRKATSSGSLDLIIGTENSADYVTVLNQFVTGGSYAIERIEFDDGTIWDSTIISRAAITPTSTAAAQGTSADDYFDLRSSVNNTVYGYSISSAESGNDTYIFSVGSGNDKVQDFGASSNNVDMLRLVGIGFEDIIVSRTGNNLVVSLNSSTDTLTVLNHFVSTSYQIEKIFSDVSDLNIDAELFNSVSLLGQVGGNTLKFVKETGYQEIQLGSNNVDVITSGNISTFLIGGSGADSLTGGQANDILSGSSGNDTLTGNAGNDTFILNSLSAQDLDSIVDFLSNEDVIALDETVFTALINSGGNLLAGNFISGAGFQNGIDTDDFLIYDSATGNLFYDADGSGPVSTVHVVSLVGAPVITYSDFVIY